MEKTEFEIKSGIKLHLIKTNNFKTNVVSGIITVPLTRENVTKNALLVSMLRRGTANLKTQQEISKKLENLYGAEFECGIDKYGDNQLLRFYIDSINDKYALNNESILENTIEILLDIICNPYLENGIFSQEYLDVEKENLKNIINSKIDEKGSYAYEDCLEKMYGKKGFGLYKYGYVEDLENINSENLTEYYKSLIQNCKINIFVSGEFDDDKVIKSIFENENIKKLHPRIENYILNNEFTEEKEKVQEPQNIVEKMDVTQGKLVIGMDVLAKGENVQYKVLMYNIIFGNSPTSLLFQNVREKASLAYSIKSVYVKQKSNIFVRAGIEIPNYDKAIGLIKKQIEMMKNGEFTDEDILSAKETVKAGIAAIETEQDTGIVYCIGQELSKSNVSVDEYLKIIENITKQDIIEVAQNVQINTIYFLRDEN